MIIRKTKVVGLISVLFFAAACAVLFLMWQYVQTKGSELLQQSKEIADFEAREQRYNDLEKLVNVTKPSRDELATYVLTEDKTINFLSTIEQVAVEQGIDLTTNSLAVVEQDGLFDTLVISFSVAGSKQRVYAMLRILETLPHHAYVSSVSFTNNKEATNAETEGVIEVTVSLLDYD